MTTRSQAGNYGANIFQSLAFNELDRDSLKNVPQDHDSLLAHTGDSLAAGETRRAAVTPILAGGVRGSEPRPGVAAAEAGRPSVAPLSLRCAVAALR